MEWDWICMGASSILRSRYDYSIIQEELEEHIDILLQLATAEDVEKYIDEYIINGEHTL